MLVSSIFVYLFLEVCSSLLCVWDDFLFDFGDYYFNVTWLWSFYKFHEGAYEESSTSIGRSVYTYGGVVRNYSSFGF